MERYTLKNGLTVIFQRSSSKSVAVEALFKVGSRNEAANIRGISHFLEHMLFEGTNKRPDSTIIANEIEKYGAEFNAYTTTTRTAFFIKIINKHIDIALAILSDMISDSLIKEDKIEKEKRVVLKEIDMITDDARQHQWVIFNKMLFDKHPARNPIYGTVETVKKINREKLLDYYGKYYTPNNMILTVVGNVHNIKKKAEKHFGALKPKKIPKVKDIIEPMQRRVNQFVEERKIQSSYIALGYKTVPRLHEDSYALDIIASILGRGQSGWIFDEIRNKHGLSYQTGVQSENDTDYGFFAAYAALDKKNIEKAKGIILSQFKRLQTITKNELDEAKMNIEGNHALEMEDTFRRADDLAVWELMKDVSMAESYLRNIQKVTVADVKKAAKKYLNDSYTFVAIRQK